MNKYVPKITTDTNYDFVFFGVAIDFEDGIGIVIGFAIWSITIDWSE